MTLREPAPGNVECCKEYSTPKFSLAWTSSLYGLQNLTLYREEANTELLLSPYSPSKKAAEVLCHTYHYLHGTDVVVL